MNKNKEKVIQQYPYRSPLRKGIGDRPIRFKCSLQNTIIDVLRSRGWVEVKDEGEFDFYWADVGWMKEYFDRCYMQEHIRINHFRNHYETCMPIHRNYSAVEHLIVTDETDFDFFWADRGWMKEYFDQCYMEDYVRINHFRNHYELTRKNLMVKNLKRYRKIIDREMGKLEASRCDFFPTTFELPSEYHMFVDEFKRNPGSVWIMKPVARSQGKGIFLFRKLKEITDWKKSDYYRPREERADDKEPPETYIVSKYIERPYLIGGRKFDLRVYVLVISYVPLKAWLYRCGFARFSNTRFSLDSIDDSYVHLTNVAVQKTAPDYDVDKGCKWSMQQIRQYCTARHGIEEVEEMFRRMNDIFIKSLQSVQKTMINDKHCFELYGYDILVDDSLKPWLIEVNASPSLTASSPEDYSLKFGLLEDVLHIIDMESRLTGKEKRIGGFDLMWDDGPVMAEEGGVDCISPPSYSTNTFLGCNNDRKRQLRQLFKQLNNQRKASAT